MECILKDERRVVPVSTDVDGMHGIDKNVFLSMPCVLGREGVIRVRRRRGVAGAVSVFGGQCCGEEEPL